MKNRQIVRETKSKKRRTLTLPPTHEQRAADEIFEETSTKINARKVDLDLSLEEEEDLEKESFVALDYGFNEDKTTDEWEVYAVESAEKFRALFVRYLATLDGFTAAQEHMNSTMGMKLAFNTSGFVNDLETMLMYKIKSEFLDVLGMQGEERTAAFIKAAVQSREAGEQAMKNLGKWLREQAGVPETETDPYGKIAITKSLGGNK